MPTNIPTIYSLRMATKSNATNKLDAPVSEDECTNFPLARVKNQAAPAGRTRDVEFRISATKKDLSPLAAFFAEEKRKAQSSEERKLRLSIQFKQTASSRTLDTVDDDSSVSSMEEEQSFGACPNNVFSSMRCYHAFKIGVQFEEDKRGEPKCEARSFEPSRDPTLWWGQDDFSLFRFDCRASVASISNEQKQDLVKASMHVMAHGSTHSGVLHKRMRETQYIRGLEHQLVTVVSALVDEHTSSVLAAQDEARKSHSNGTDEGMESIRKTCLWTSSMCSKLAAQRARFDATEAVKSASTEEAKNEMVFLD